MTEEQRAAHTAKMEAKRRRATRLHEATLAARARAAGGDLTTRRHVSDALQKHGLNYSTVMKGMD